MKLKNIKAKYVQGVLVKLNNKPIDHWNSELFGHIHSISSAVPEFKATQKDALEMLSKIFDLKHSDQARIAQIFSNTGIEQRHISAPVDWYIKPQSWSDKNKLYIETSLQLLKEAATKSLEKANWSAEEVDHIIVISTTGIATPSLDAHLLNLMPFRQDVTRTPIFGLGCAGGLMGLARAAAIAKSAPGSKVLLLVVELCSLNFQRKKFDKKNLIASALFADGAAAVTISTLSGQAKIISNLERTWPKTLDIMGWDVEDSGLSVIFSQSIPNLVADKMKPFIQDFLLNQKIHLNQINKYISHPGGAKVINALENCFELTNGEMKESRQTLSRFGNMSAPTILFALESALEQKEKITANEKWLLSSLGPGFTGVVGLLEVSV